MINLIIRQPQYFEIPLSAPSRGHYTHNGRTSSSDSADVSMLYPTAPKFPPRLEEVTLASKSTRHPVPSVVGGLHSEAIPRLFRPVFRPTV